MNVPLMEVDSGREIILRLIAHMNTMRINERHSNIPLSVLRDVDRDLWELLTEACVHYGTGYSMIERARAEWVGRQTWSWS